MTQRAPNAFPAVAANIIHKPEDVLGARYSIIDSIGSGGMQEVYRAHDMTLDRIVALKVPKSASAERRFKRSAVLSAKVNHPNAAKTLDYFDDGGRSYLIEEFIEGQDLRFVQSRLPVMDPYLVAHILHHLARGVAASHHVNVVHRDLKPGNIMLSPGVSFDVIKVTDFGIAKMAEEEIKAAVEGGEEKTENSQTAVGALPYMSPEMVLTPGDSGKATDVWALGAIAFELLTGKKPFGSGLKAIPQILKAELPDVSRVYLNPQFDGLRAELFDLIRMCIVLDPSKRVTADALHEACSALCYADCTRSEGTVTNMPFGSKSYGFLSSKGTEIFFHTESVYGDQVSVGDNVCFASFPGEPYPRAHPVVRLAARAVTG